MGKVVFQEGAFPHVAITCNKAEIITEKSVIMFQNQPERMEKGKKKISERFVSRQTDQSSEPGH